MDYAISLGARLLTLVEAQAYIAEKGQLLTTGNINVYVPVGDPSNRDWMMIGNAGTSYPTGYSHVTN